MSDQKKENPNRGSSLDDLLAKEGVLQKFQGEVIKRVMTWLIKNQALFILLLFEITTTYTRIAA